LAKHNDKEFQDKLKMSFRLRLEEQFKSGLAQGMYAALKIVYDKTKDETKTPEERLESIRQFCIPSLTVKNSKGEVVSKADE